MKKGFWIVAVLGIVGFLILVVIDRNLKLIRQNKAVSPQAVSEEVQKEGVPDEVTVAQELISQGPVEIAPEEPAKPAPRNFLADAVHSIGLYQKANQQFLEDRRIKAETLTQTEEAFSEALTAAYSLEPSPGPQVQVKESLVLAAEARLRSIRILSQMKKTAEDAAIDNLWAENVTFLKKANESVTQAVQLTGELISNEPEKPEDAGDPSFLFEDLQKCTKGILVISRSEK